MKITILGGGGFIGSHIADRLLEDNHELRIFERPRVNPYRQFSAAEKVDWITGDLMSRHDVDLAINGADVVLHLVCTTLPKSSNDDPVYDVQSNLAASLQLIQAMADKGVGKIVFISSGGTVYGESVYLPIDEQHPTNPITAYGISKLAIEKYLLMYQHLYGIQATVLRVANPFGERQRIQTAQGAVTAFIDCALRNQSIEIWGDGQVTRDYLYVADVAEAFARAVDYNGKTSVFNISSGVGVSLNELLETIERILERTVDHIHLPGRPFDVQKSVLCNSLAKQELGWEPTVSLERGIVQTIQWLKKVANQ
jgi:UDP-glucose 4-epimerase